MKLNNYQLSNKEQNHLILDWLKTNPEYLTLAITVNFKRSRLYRTKKVMREQAIRDYRMIALPKIKKRLNRNPEKWNLVMPFQDLFVYEYDHHRNYGFKKTSSSEAGEGRDNSIPHIHGVITILGDLKNRIFLDDGWTIDDRLVKDLYSTGKISSVDLRPIERETKFDWYHYMSKQKKAHEFIY